MTKLLTKIYPGSTINSCFISRSQDHKPDHHDPHAADYSGGVLAAGTTWFIQGTVPPRAGLFAGSPEEHSGGYCDPFARNSDSVTSSSHA